MVFLRKVDYSIERPRVDGDDVSFADFLTKSKEWCDESEWRVLLPLNWADEVAIKGAEDIHLFSLPPSAVKRAVLGCKADGWVEVKVQEALARNPGARHIELFRARVDEEHFQLHFDKAIS